MNTFKENLTAIPLHTRSRNIIKRLAIAFDAKTSKPLLPYAKGNEIGYFDIKAVWHIRITCPRLDSSFIEFDCTDP